MKRIFYTIIGLVGMSLGLRAQTPTTAQTTLKYNCASGKYGVYAKFNQNGPVSIGSSLISIILPGSYTNQALTITPINGGGWADASVSYDKIGKDYHGISTTGQGNMAYGTAGSELLLFEFNLSVTCASDVRLWTQGVDDDQTNDGTDYVSNIFTPANNNYILTTNYAPIGILSASATGTPATCNSSNGTINLSVQNNLCPLTYLWSNGATTQNLTGLSAGAYTVTVTGNPTCTASTSYTVNSSSDVTLTCSKVDVTTSGGSNGSASVSANGGTTPYTYLWSNGGTTATITGLTAGTYTVTVTDANGCPKICSSTVNQPSCNLTATINGTNVSCFGLATGSVTVSSSGNTSPLTYLWNNGATTQNLSNLAVGTYTVTVTENINCKVSQTYTVTQPSDLTLNCTKTDVSISGGSNGSASVSASGGTTPYTYLWSNGGTTSSIMGLTAGSYTVTVTSANGCQKICSSTVNQPICNLILSCTKTDISTATSNDGTASVAASGGTTPYTYFWSNGAATSSISGLAPNVYSVTVTDANGCSKTCSSAINSPCIVITQPAALTVDIAGTKVNCNGGTTGAANLTASGGTTPYTYLWSNGATTEDLNNLGAGTYSVTLTDANGCTKTNSVTITEPTAITVSVAGSNVNCNGGTTGAANLTVSGGTSPYTYVWSNGVITEDLSSVGAGTYSVTVTDTKGCTKIGSVTITQPTALSAVVSATDVSCNGSNTGNINLTASGGTTPYSFAWSNGATTQNANNLVAGFYSVTVTDANGCTKTAAATINEPTAITVSVAGTNVSCNGGTTGAANLTVSGGTSPYTYVWNNGVTTEDLSNIGAGTYSVTVTDAKGCTKIGNVTITQPTGLTFTFSQQNAKCFGESSGSVQLMGVGGTAPYQYSLDDGLTFPNTNGIFNNLGAGAYKPAVKDANGCTTKCQ